MMQSRAKITLILMLLSFLLAVSFSSVVQADSNQKIKHFIMIDLTDGYDRLWLDRWYMTYHAPERRQVMRNYQRHYLSYATYETPTGGAKFDVIRGRMTEIHFDSLEAFYAGRLNNSVGSDYHVPPPLGWRKFGQITTATMPTNPTQVFVGGFPKTIDHPYFRWVVFLKYPDTQPQSEIDDWYNNVHAQEAKLMPGLRRFVSYSTLGKTRKYDRVSEFWFDTYADWHKAVVESPQAYTLPSWSSEYPFMEIKSAFIGERPDIDFINDHSSIP